MRYGGSRLIDFALELDLAGFGPQQSRNPAQDGGLAGAVGADQTNDPAGFDSQVDAFDGDDLAVGQNKLVHRQERAHAVPVSLRLRAVRAAEVGLDHGRMNADFAGRPLGDLAAEIEHGEAIAEPHDEVHVVLDQQDGEAAAAQRLQQCGKRGGLGRIHSGRGLVEQEQLRIRRQRTRDLKPPLVAISKRGRQADPRDPQA